MRKAILAVLAAAIGAGGWYYYAPLTDDRARMAEIQTMLDAAKRVNEEVLALKRNEAELQKQLDAARLAEAKAKKSGDAAGQRELAEQAKQLEAELLKQAERIERLEAQAMKQAEAARRRQDELSSGRVRREEEAALKCKPENLQALTREKAEGTPEVTATADANTAMRKGCG